MKRIVHTLSIEDSEKIKKQLLGWSQTYTYVSWLDSNTHKDVYSQYDALLAVGAEHIFSSSAERAFEGLKDFRDLNQDWLFGYLSYDLKNDLERLKSENQATIYFPEIFFFRPKKIISLRDGQLQFSYLKSLKEDIEKDIDTILNFSLDEKEINPTPIRIQLSMSKDEYKERVKTMLSHIHRGDIYEANFCQEFHASGKINPLHTYKRLNTISQAPFASFLKLNKKYVLCSSPERYIQKKGGNVISQPIKGTAPRGANLEEDKNMIDQLKADPKERAENIMITDLVRNDLSRFAKKGTVHVDELCKVYTFKQVHQMISTISARLQDTVDPVEILKHTFPMGSMTGAPKVSAMKIIETLEISKRGVYSGAIGYFTPQGDFDFNVVIRSILYDEKKEKISYSVGGAITALSDPDKEYEECLLKAKALRAVLE